MAIRQEQQWFPLKKQFLKIGKTLKEVFSLNLFRNILVNAGNIRKRDTSNEKIPLVGILDEKNVILTQFSSRITIFLKRSANVFDLASVCSYSASIITFTM